MKKRDSIAEAYAFGPVIFASDTRGSIVTTMKITSFEIIDDIISGKRRGLSPEIIIPEWVCSICHEDLEECPHEIGKRYDKDLCQAIAKNIKFDSSSIVEKPADPKCRITDLLIIKESGGLREYEWYGFRPNNDLDHSKNIQKALESNLLPAKAAFHFGKFFSINLMGRVHYP